MIAPTYAVFGDLLSPACQAALSERGVTPILLPRFVPLPYPVCSHADMFFCKIGKYLVASPLYLEPLKPLAELIRCELLYDRGDFKSGYPDEAKFNAFVIKNYVFCRKKTVSPKILEAAEAQSFHIVDVKQGYAACSCAQAGFQAFITADRDLADKGVKNGFDVLLTEPGAIRTDVYSYGFIGGASGYYKNALYFAGNIKKHPQYPSIYLFCKKNETKLVSLSEEPLSDVGGIRFF